MKIFVVGCSYTSWSDTGNPNPGQTWPALLSRYNTDHTVVDCSFPGLSNNAYFFRLQQAEHFFGKADKVIVQWTTPYRDFFILKDDYKPTKWKQIYKNYFCNPYDKNSTWLKLRPQQNLDYTSKMLELPTKVISRFVTTWLASPNVKYHFEREFKLINSYYGKENVLHYIHLDNEFYNHYLRYMYGCAEETMPLFKKFLIDNEGHLKTPGHKELYKWLTPGITDLLEKGNK